METLYWLQATPLRRTPSFSHWSECTSCRQQGYVGSKTFLQQNSSILEVEILSNRLTFIMTEMVSYHIMCQNIVYHMSIWHSFFLKKCVIVYCGAYITLLWLVFSLRWLQISDTFWVGRHWSVPPYRYRLCPCIYARLLSWHTALSQSKK